MDVEVNLPELKSLVWHAIQGYSGYIFPWGELLAQQAKAIHCLPYAKCMDTLTFLM
jgi:hypothetical protein